MTHDIFGDRFTVMLQRFSASVSPALSPLYLDTLLKQVKLTKLQNVDANTAVNTIALVSSYLTNQLS